MTSNTIDLAIAFDEGIDEGERRARRRGSLEGAKAAVLECEVERLQRLLLGLQRRLADREKLIYAMLAAPQVFHPWLVVDPELRP